MRILNRKDFLKLPPGTLFCKGCEWCFDNLSFKGNSWDNDFLYVDLCNIQANDSGDLIDRLEDSLKNGNSYPINDHLMRDGTFDEKALFLIFEIKDLQFLIDIMQTSIQSVTLPPRTVTTLNE